MKMKSESEVAQSYPTLCDSGSPPGSSAHGIFQARVLEWVAIAFSISVLYSGISKLSILYLCVFSCSFMFNSLWLCGLQPARLLCPWNSPGKNTGVSCYFLLQGIFPIQESNMCLLHLLHWRADSLPLTLPEKLLHVVCAYVIPNVPIYPPTPSPHNSAGKESACNAGDPGQSPVLERSDGEEIGYPFQYSWASLVAWIVKNSPAMWETWV